MKVIREPADWRKDQKLSLPAVAKKLGLEGKNPARQVQRYETGAAQAPAGIVERYREISGGKVTPESFHAARLGWLRKNGLLPANPEPATPQSEAQPCSAPSS